MSEVSLRPIRVVEDSRCPADVSCIWAGRLLLRVDVRSRHRRQQIDIEQGRRFAVAGGTLTLTGVAPVRSAGRALRPSDYRFDLRFVTSR